MSTDSAAKYLNEVRYQLDSELDNDEIKYWVETLLLDLVDQDESRAIEVINSLSDDYS